MESEIIEIVNRNGKVIRKARRATAYKKGLLHKAVNIVIFNSNGKIFLQQRSSNKSAFPLYWDISAAEHLKPKETFRKAAMRGLKEELSIKLPIRKIRSKHIQVSEFIKNGQNIIENELVELYSGKFDGKIKIDKKEVESGKFIPLSKLEGMLKTEKFTPWGIEEIEYILNRKTLI